jgi:hypothetical protein
MLFVILGLMLGASAAAAKPAGTVIAVSGSCTGHGRVLKRGDPVEVSDTVQVPQDGHLQLQMADASVILFAPGSIMTLISYDVGAGGARYVKLSLTQGLLRARVTPVRGPSTFEVSISVGTASVRSSSADWFVKAQADSGQVGVLEGTVDLRSAATERSVSIPSHWGTRVQAGLDSMLPRRWGESDFNPVMALTACCKGNPALGQGPYR